MECALRGKYLYIIDEIDTGYSWVWHMTTTSGLPGCVRSAYTCVKQDSSPSIPRYTTGTTSISKANRIQESFLFIKGQVALPVPVDS